jgi:metal-responsive CopG/Arc/MetJ family transcriptional regulator
MLNSEAASEVEAKEKAARISVSPPDDLLNDFDDTAKKKVYFKRPEAMERSCITS